MYSVLACLAAFVAGAVCAPVVTDPVVNLGYARYRGVRNDTTGYELTA